MCIWHDYRVVSTHTEPMYYVPRDTIPPERMQEYNDWISGSTGQNPQIVKRVLVCRKCGDKIVV